MVLSLGAAGCALKSDVRRVEDQLEVMRAESARLDSARALQLNEVILLQARLMDSLAASQRSLKALRGEIANDLYGINQQLVQVQELTGQGQRRLTELRAQLEARSEQLNSGAAAGGAAAADTARSPSGGGASAEQMYEASVQELRRGSLSTARLGFRELLRLHPTSERVPDAMYFIGETFSVASPDSAAFYWNQVVATYPTSSRAATALYKLGLLAEQRRDAATAKSMYQRVVQEHPKSDEAALARDRLKALGR